LLARKAIAISILRRIFKKVDRMTTAIYFNEMTQRIVRGSERRKIAQAKEMAKPREIT